MNRWCSHSRFMFRKVSLKFERLWSNSPPSSFKRIIQSALCHTFPLHSIMYSTVSSRRVCFNKTQMPQEVEETKSRVFTRHITPTTPLSVTSPRTVVHPYLEWQMGEIHHKCQLSRTSQKSMQTTTHLASISHTSEHLLCCRTQRT